MKNDSFVDIYVNCEPEFLDGAQYVFATLFEILGIPFQFRRSELPKNSNFQKIIINYVPGTNKQNFPNAFVINIAAFEYDRFFQLKVEPEVRFIDGIETSEKIGYFFSKRFRNLEKTLFLDKTTGKPLITCDEDQINCSVDLISSAFHLLTLQNEECIKKRDSLGRFQRNFSKKSNEIYTYPIVDLYCKLLFDFLKMASKRLSIPIVQKAFWPYKYQFALCLTHDIDRFNVWTIRKVIRTCIFFLRNRYNSKITFWKKLIQLFRSIINATNWKGNFSFIINQEKNFQFNSSFFFVAQKLDSLDPNYKIDSKRLANTFRFLINAGVEIGLHGSIRSADSKHQLEKERGMLEKVSNQNIYGSRQHFLRFMYPETFENIAQANLNYDSTVGFNDAIGYRAGISFPFMPYHRSQKKAFNFYEIPLHVMDAAIMKDDEYRVLDDNNYSRLFGQVESCLKNAHNFNGCLTVLWHNSDFDPVDVTGYTKLYRDILKWTKKNNGWGCSAYELCNWWKTRGEYKLAYSILDKGGLSITASGFKSDCIFLKIYFPEFYQNFLFDFQDCNVSWIYEEPFVSLDIKNISSDLIELKIYPKD